MRTISFIFALTLASSCAPMADAASTGKTLVADYTFFRTVCVKSACSEGSNRVNVRTHFGADGRFQQGTRRSGTIGAVTPTKTGSIRWMKTSRGYAVVGKSGPATTRIDFAVRGDRCSLGAVQVNHDKKVQMYGRVVMHSCRVVEGRGA
jgi:hypothetical protein